MRFYTLGWFPSIQKDWISQYGLFPETTARNLIHLGLKDLPIRLLIMAKTVELFGEAARTHFAHVFAFPVHSLVTIRCKPVMALSRRLGSQS